MNQYICHYPVVCFAFLMFGVFLLTGCNGETNDAIRTLTFPGEASAGSANAETEADTFQLHAKLYLPTRSEIEKPPGLILVHRAGGDHAVWERFAQRARHAGYLVLALDLRGHGQSAQPPGYPGTHLDYTRTQWLDCLEDISVALDQLLDAGANPANIGIMGEGLGANLALHWYHRHPGVQAVVALSPGLDYEGIKVEAVVRELQQRPALYLATEDDNYSVRSATSLRDMTPGFAELRTFRGFAYGAEIYEQSASAMEITLQWLDAILKPEEEPGAE